MDKDIQITLIILMVAWMIGITILVTAVEAIKQSYEKKLRRKRRFQRY
jgi:hypothetical protein